MRIVLLLVFGIDCNLDFRGIAVAWQAERMGAKVKVSIDGVRGGIKAEVEIRENTHDRFLHRVLEERALAGELAFLDGAPGAPGDETAEGHAKEGEDVVEEGVLDDGPLAVAEEVDGAEAGPGVEADVGGSSQQDQAALDDHDMAAAKEKRPPVEVRSQGDRREQKGRCALRDLQRFESI